MPNPTASSSSPSFERSGRPPTTRRPGSRFDSSIALLADPYGFISSECRAAGTDLFETRILLQRTICMTGPAAAEVFYDTRRCQRSGAAPEPLRATLFGKGGVQGLDDDAHRRRKALFLDILSTRRIAALAARTEHEWEEHIEEWSKKPPFRLYDAVQVLLTRSVCAWAGVPLPATDVAMRTRQLVALFDSAASGPLRHLQARRARRAAEQWLGRLIEDARAGRIALSPLSAAHAIANHVDADGRLLPPRIAAVELLNVLRPTVAVSVYVVFIAHALHLHAGSRVPLQHGDDPGYIDRFVQEVRRLYPFFPAVVAKVRDPFEWNGHPFPRGRRLMLDLYGTNHDARVWDAPDEFRPDRFAGPQPLPFAFIPQGGAQAHTNHRCPGEDTTITLMKMAADFLANRIGYDVPRQDLRIDMRRLPALPADGFVIANVHAL